MQLGSLLLRHTGGMTRRKDSTVRWTHLEIPVAAHDHGDDTDTCPCVIKEATMTDTNTSDDVTVELHEDHLAALDDVARQRHDSDFASLDYEQAMSLMSAYLRQLAETSTDATARVGGITVSAEMDGAQAAAAFVTRDVANLAPRIDDERTLEVRIKQDRTMWQILTGQHPARVLRFVPDCPNSV